MGEPGVAVDLEAVAEARLDDAGPLDLGDEAVEVGEEVEVDAAEVAGDGSAEEAAEAGRGLRRTGDRGGAAWA